MRKVGFAGILTICLLAGTLLSWSRPVKAAETEGTYTVRVYAGTQGSFGGQEYAQETYAYGSDFVPASFLAKHPLTENAPYEYAYIHVAGQDELQQQAIHVEKDLDVVVRYKVPGGEQVSYTVRYLTRTGTTLRPDQTFTGSAGEELYVPYLEINGYYPNTRNYHVTSLSSGLTITFVYTPNPTPAPTVAPTTTQTQVQYIPAAGTTGTAGTAGTGTEGEGIGTGTEGTEGGTTGTAGTGGAAGTEGTGGTTETGGAGGTTGETGNAGGPAPEGDAATVPNANTLPQTPEEIPEVIDIGDEEVPLANFPGSGNETGNGTAVLGDNTTNGNTTEEGNTTDIEDGRESGSGISTAVKAGIGIAAAAVIAIIAAVLVRRRRS